MNVTIPVIRRSELKFELGAYGMRFPGGVAGQQIASVAPAEEFVCRGADILEIILFGKLHLVTAEQFIQEAAKYHKVLGKEALLMLDSVRTQQQVFNEWALPQKWSEQIVSWVSQGVSTKLNDDITNRYDTLWSGACKTLGDLEKRDLRYEIILEIGVSLHEIRANLAALCRFVNGYREGVIQKAETVTKGLETVESTSFQVLGLVPTIFLMDPLREAAYKIGLIVIRGFARHRGAVIAETDTTREVCGVLKQDVPPLLVDMITKLPAFKVLHKNRKYDQILKSALRQIIEFLCDVGLLVIEKKGDFKKIETGDLRQLGEKRLTSAVAEVLSALFGGSPHDTAGRKWWNSVIESAINTVHRDLWDAYEKARSQQPEQSTWEVFVQELPWTIVKFVQGILVGGMQRQAATGGEIGRDTGLTEKHDWKYWTHDGLRYMRENDASAIFTGKYTGVMPKQKRPPLKDLNKEDPKIVENLLKTTGLDPVRAAGLRRGAHEQDLIMAIRVLNKVSAGLLKYPGVFPKSKDLKAKTVLLEGHPLSGRLARPMKDPPTHDPRDYDETKKLWNASVPSMEQMGCFFREDGLVFHPKMLEHAASAGGDGDLASKAKDFLNNRAKGRDLGSRENKALLAREPDVAGFIDKAMVGFASDLDVAEIVDARTCDRRVLGSGDKGSQFEHSIARINQDQIDRIVKEANTTGVRERGWFWEDPPPRLGELYDPDPRSFVQHGGDYEYYAGHPVEGGGSHEAGGPIFIVGPNNLAMRIDYDHPAVRGIADRKKQDEKIRLLWDEFLKSHFADNYKESALRGQQLRKTSLSDKTNYQDATGPGKIIRTDDVARRMRYYYQQSTEAEGRGTSPPAPWDLLGSLIHRGLVPVWTDRPPRRSDDNDLIRAQQKHGVVVGHDTDRKNYVVGIATSASVGDSLAKLARAAVESSLLGRSDVAVWYELYTRFRPVTSDYVLGRIGGKDPGIPRGGSDVGLGLSSLQMSGDRRLYAFSVDGFHETYWPNSEEHKKSLARLGYIGKDIDAAPPYPKTEGLRLFDVWERSDSLELEYEPTTIAGRQVVVFTAGIVSVPADASFREYPVAGADLLA